MLRSKSLDQWQDHRMNRFALLFFSNLTCNGVTGDDLWQLGCPWFIHLHSPQAAFSLNWVIKTVLPGTIKSWLCTMRICVLKLHIQTTTGESMEKCINLKRWKLLWLKSLLFVSSFEPFLIQNVSMSFSTTIFIGAIFYLILCIPVFNIFLLAE